MHRAVFVFFLLITFSCAVHAQSNPKNRVIILSDIEADPDDTESFVRLFLYANEIDIKGIVATTSCWMKTSIHPESIHKIIRAYDKVQPNLLKHKPGFPKAKDLLLLVKTGLPKYGMDGVGDGNDSEGSEWIIKKLEEKDERPLWISVWGGSNTLAQALYKIKKTKTAAEAAALVSKLRVYTISDQDDTGIWMRNNFPDLFYIVSPGDDYAASTWTGINTRVKGIKNDKISNDWLQQNIQQGHGPLGALYPDVAYGMEGDTPSWLSLIRNGLNEPEHPEWGGWGGRYELSRPDFRKQKKGRSGVPFEPETRQIWTDVTDSFALFVHQPYGRTIRKTNTTFTGNKVTIWRWRDDFQNDFAARMDWCTKNFKEANHAPVAVLSHPEQISAQSGENFTMDAGASTDPDGDNLSFLWINYPEAGSYKKRVGISAENLHAITITAPEVDKKESIHFIVKVSDKGSPSLCAYKRIIVTVSPK